MLAKGLKIFIFYGLWHACELCDGYGKKYFSYSLIFGSG
jgi:hypothetical protein